MSFLASLTLLLAAGTGLPVQVPPVRGGSLVVSIEAWAGERGEVNVIGWNPAEKMVMSPARAAGLDAVERVLVGLGYAVERRSTGAVRYARPVCEVGLGLGEDDADVYCAPEGGRPCLLPPGLDDEDDTAPMSIEAVEQLIAMGVGL